MATKAVPKIRHRVRALDQRPPWCIPLPEWATVAELARAVEVRENQLLPGEEAPVSVGIQVEYRDELCAVSPVDLLVDHVPADSKDAMFVAVRKSGGSLASSLISRENAPSLAAPVAPTLHVVGAATGPESFRLQPRVSPSDTAVVSPIILPLPSSDAASAGGPNNSDVGAGSTGVDEAVAGGTEMSNGGPASESDTSGSCDACNAVFTIATPTFCCRICRKLFHSECAGYNTSTKRQSPPPDWICPRCPNGERGPSETIHRSLKGKGVVKQQRGNQPFCPICLGDDRVPGKGRIGRCSMTKCRGCGLHTHADCLKKLDIGPDGRWPCDECQRRRDGVVPGNNPAWLRLKEARLDGGWEVSAVPDAASAAAAAAAVEETGAAAAASLDPNPTEDLGHLQPSSKSAERRTRTRVGSTRRRSAPGGRASGDGTTSCCKKSVTPKRPVFCCRVCRKLFHGPCAGYDPKGRQVPPPDWICPNCPNGERGPGENLVDPSLKGKGVVNQKHGNMPWCPICLSDNRVSGKKRLGDIERCPGCSFHTHAHCLAGLQIYHDGRWPCDECDRRRHGVVPGDNPVWKRLKAARLDGGRKPTWTHSWTQVPSSLGAAGATPPAIAPSDSPNSDVAGSLKGSAPSSTTVKVGAETATGVCEPAEGTPPVFHDQDPVQNQHRHTTVPGSQELAATGGVGCVLPAAAAGAATETAADTAAGACEPPEGTPPVFDDQDHVQNHSTVPGSHEMAVTGGVVSLLPAAAAGAATEREALRSPPAGSPFSDHMHFSQRRRPSGVVEMAIRAAVEAVAVVAAASAGAPASRDPPLGPAPSSAEVLAARGAAARPPEAAETGCQSVGSWFMGCSTLPSEDSSEAPAVLAVAPAAGPATPAGVGGDPVAEGRKTDPEQTISSPPRAKESSRGITGDESNNAHTPADAPPNGNSSSEGRSSCCEACGKVFIPSLRPSFCCRACRNLFHGDCAGYARHKRQCPPPDWICPHCPNGERGPTEYDTHTSLKGKGAVHQKLGNQLWCPICFGDDRALGSAQNGPGGKKCPGCGLRTHGHCMSGLEIGPDGRWPCDECQRRRDGINPGDNSLWLRLKTARLDGGPAVAITSVPLPTSGATTTTAAAASTWLPQISGAGPSSCSATRSADAGPAKAAGAVCPLAANASLLSVAPLHGGVQTPSTSPLPSEVTASAPSTSKAPATPMDSSQAFSSCGAPTSSTASAASATPPTRPLSPPSFSCQPAQPVALPVSPPASRTSVPTDLPGSPSSPASSLGGAMQGSAPASSNAAAPSRVDTTEPSDMVEDDDVLIPGDVSGDDGAAGASSQHSPISGPAAAQGTPIGASSLVTTAVRSVPVPPGRATAPVARAVSDGNDDGQNSENQVARSDGSNRDRAAATVSQQASKKPRLADGTTGQLPPRSAVQNRVKAAEAIAVAAAQLLGGMPDQQREAEAFVGTELANDNMDLCNQLVVRLKRTVDVNEGGVWVNRMAVADLCGTGNTPTDFPCVVQYIVGTGCRKSPKESRREARASFSQVLTRAQGSGSAFEAYNVGGESMLRWKGGTSA